jgi:hypothetical protein
MEKVSEIETLGIFIDSVTDIVGPIFVEEAITTVSGKTGETGEYLAATVLLMIPINRKPSVVKNFRDVKKGDRS